jgi:hypothetical protein
MTSLLVTQSSVTRLMYILVVEKVTADMANQVAQLMFLNCLHSSSNFHFDRVLFIILLTNELLIL